MKQIYFKPVILIKQLNFGSSYCVTSAQSTIENYDEGETFDW